MRIFDNLKSFKNPILILVVLILTCFTLSACTPSFNTGGGDAKTEEFTKGKVVKGFPTNLPFYKNATIIESYGGKNGYGASFIADDNLAKVVNFYNQSLPQLGWTTQLRKESETNLVFDIKNDKNQGQVIVNVAADGKKTAITMSLSER